MPINGLHMLPNLKILVCGVVFGLLLFAVTGAGVMLPDSHTRVGEMPEVSRPMMRPMIADEPGQAQFQAISAARRSEELERLRERTFVEVASAPEPVQPESDSGKPGTAENTVANKMLADAGEALTPQPAQATEVDSGPASVSAQAPPAPEITPDATPEAADTVQVAAVPPISSDADPAESAPALAKVPLPRLRPSTVTSGIHRRVVHRKHAAAPASPPENTGQNLFQQPPSWAR